MMQAEGTACARALRQVPHLACWWKSQITQDLVGRVRGLPANLK